MNYITTLIIGRDTESYADRLLKTREEVLRGLRKVCVKFPLDVQAQTRINQDQMKRMKSMEH
jgi:hypothetical protein